MNRNRIHKGLIIRLAQPNDASEIIMMIKELAEYQNHPDAVTATPQDIAAQMGSAKPPFECILAEVDHKVIGFALFFPNYSTWQGRPGLFLEDLYVQPDHRGTAVGKKLLCELAKICRERNYGRMEWEVRPSNQPAIDFYESLGAEFLDKKKCRLSGNRLHRL